MFKFVEFRGPRGMLRGALHLPDGARKPSPAVVLCHGCTGERMESAFLFVLLSRALEASGIASLRFDFYGSGESDGDFLEMTVSSEVADANVALDFLRTTKGVDPQRLGLMGISLGGYVTSCVLGRRRDVKAAALWSAAGRTKSRWLTRFSDEQKELLRERGWVNIHGLRLSNDFLEDLENNKPYEEIARYGGPVLVVHGTADDVVPLDEAREYTRILKARPAKALSDNLFVDGAGHTYNNWDHRQLIYDRTVEWFRLHLA